jgi:hypothetical protein
MFGQADLTEWQMKRWLNTAQGAPASYEAFCGSQILGSL